MAKTDSTIYELGYNLIPTIAEEQVAKEVGAIKEAITSAGGTVIADEYPSLMALAYEMSKEIDNKNVRFSSAYFGWVKFEMDPEGIAAIKKMADTSAFFLRSLIIKTVRENTIHTPKFSGRSRKSSSDEAPTGETAAPMDAAAVDQKIDEMVDGESSL